MLDVTIAKAHKALVVATTADGVNLATEAALDAVAVYTKVMATCGVTPVGRLAAMTTCIVTGFSEFAERWYRSSRRSPGAIVFS